MEDLSVLNQYITVSKKVAGGQPVFRGTHITVKSLFDHLRESNLAEFLAENPEVTREQADAIIELVVAKDFL